MVLKELIFNISVCGLETTTLEGAERTVLKKELILTADPVEWINLINFKKITNILVILNTCNSSIFFSSF